MFFRRFTAFSLNTITWPFLLLSNAVFYIEMLNLETFLDFLVFLYS